MAIKIGHSAIDENGNIHSGTAGDQNKQEVCIGNWWNKGWNVLLRPKSATLAEKSAKACEAGCANDKVGYDQYQRNTLYTQAKAVGYDLAKIATACECDCSAFMHVCAIAGGANLSYGSNGHTTRSMVNAFVNSGNYEKLTDSKYLTSDKYLKRGDILVKEGSHTVMVLSNGYAVQDSAQFCEEKYKNTYTATTALNLRSGVGTSKSIVAVIPKGGEVVCNGYYSLNGSTPWLLVQYGDKTGFCSSKYLQAVKSTEPATGRVTDSATKPATGTVTGCTWVNVRKTPNGTILKAIKAGTEVTIIGEGKDSDGDIWYKITTGSLTGYIFPKYVIKA